MRRRWTIDTINLDTHGTLIAVRFNSGAHVDLSPTESAVLALDLIRFADEADPAVFERLEKEERK
ncbi:hypothetical protein [uncultured Thermomonospora sp.]|uniref:hypothetical protein n=1 Tax=uncultured Thermomonospora sp. TaxID=671175 RepID=UPI00259BC94F|nr:hypothetical protein [uncultured Thermomonospora sp.]